MFNYYIKRINILNKLNLIYFLISCFCFIMTKATLANEDDIINSVKDILPTNNQYHAANDHLNTKIHYPEYQVEIILFSNLNPTDSSYKQSSSNSDYKDLNKSGAIDFQLKVVKPKFLVNAYEKLNNDPNYKVLYFAATQYSLLPSQKVKKFFISSKGKNNNYQNDLQNFATILIINKNKNVFNIMCDSIVNKVRLKKIFKLKSKETYYFDHETFGALITIVNL